MLRQLRNWFQPAPTPEKTSQDASEPPIVSDPVSDDLLRDVRRLEADLAQLRLEWAETLDKLNAWASRQATRDRRAFGRKLEEAPDDAQQQQNDTPPNYSAAPPTKAELRQRLANLQRKALG